MQGMVTDINNLRWSHPAVRSASGQVTHTDSTNNILAFKRWNDAGDVVLVVVNASDHQWSDGDYLVCLAGDSGSWQEIFNSQAPLYGGINTVGNPGPARSAAGGQLSLNVASWSVHVFCKQ